MEHSKNYRRIILEEQGLVLLIKVTELVLRVMELGILILKLASIQKWEQSLGVIQKMQYCETLLIWLIEMVFMNLMLIMEKIEF